MSPAGQTQSPRLRRSQFQVHVAACARMESNIVVVVVVAGVVVFVRHLLHLATVLGFFANGKTSAPETSFSFAVSVVVVFRALRSISTKSARRATRRAFVAFEGRESASFVVFSIEEKFSARFFCVCRISRKTFYSSDCFELFLTFEEEKTPKKAGDDLLGFHI